MNYSGCTNYWLPLGNAHAINRWWVNHKRHQRLVEVCVLGPVIPHIEKSDGAPAVEVEWFRYSEAPKSRPDDVDYPGEF